MKMYTVSNCEFNRKWNTNIIGSVYTLNHPPSYTPVKVENISTLYLAKTEVFSMMQLYDNALQGIAIENNWNKQDIAILFTIENRGKYGFVAGAIVYHRKYNYPVIALSHNGYYNYVQKGL